MKKGLLSVFVAVCLVVSVFAFAACGGGATDTKNLTLNARTLSVEQGKTVELKATSVDIDGDIAWSTDKASVVSLDKTKGANVTLTGLAVGTVVVTASAGDKTASCTVTVTPDTTPSLKLDHSELEIDQYTSATLSADVKNISGEVKWTTSSNLTVSLGSNSGNQVTVTGLKAGSSTITASIGGKMAVCIVTVNYVASPDNPSDEGWNVTDNGDGTYKYKFEAESGDMQYAPSDEMGAKLPTKGLETTLVKNNYPSGDAYVYNLDFGVKYSETGMTIVYEIYSSEQTEATLSIAMGLGKNAGTCNEIWEISVNGNALTVSEDVNFPVYTGTVWYDWNNVEVGKVLLIKGKNTLVFKYIWRNGMNFDYFTLDVPSSVTLAVDAEHNLGAHKYGEWQLLEEPTDIETGLARMYCEYCRYYGTKTITAIGGDGWTEEVVVQNDEYHYGVSDMQYFIDGKLMCSYRKLKNPTGQTAEYKFECENMAYTGEAQPKNGELNSNASNDGYMGNLNTKSFSITLTVHAEQDCSAILIFCGGFKSGVTVKFNDNGGQLLVGGEEIPVDAGVKFVGKGWTTWFEVEICVVNLKAGDNTITLNHLNKGNYGNLDYWKLISPSVLIEVLPEEEV
ncbi:MAG: hypothetical protein HFE48_04995 [Clostridia bacterium]|nr:hypothetical protein [Clostridia bacterium]